jgi:hypothetical protein
MKRIGLLLTVSALLLISREAPARSLSMLKIKLRMSTPTVVKIKGTFPATQVDEAPNPHVELRLGDVALLDTDAEDGSWSIRRNGSRGYRIGKRKVLRIDFLKGRLRFRRKGLDLSSLEEKGQTLVLVIDDVTYVADCDFTTKGGKWSFSATSSRPLLGPPLPEPDPPGDDPVPPPEEPWRIIAWGGYSGITGIETHVIRTEAEWRNLWNRHHSIVWPGPPPLPHVDFKKETLLAIFAGTFSSGGYGVELTSVEPGEGGLLVDWTEWHAGPNCMVTAAESRPHVIFTIPRETRAIIFRRTVEIFECPEYK